MNKTLAFDYFVYQLVNWYREAYGDGIENDLSTLKVLKLLFFTTAIGAKKDDNTSLLDSTFDSFYALPYGHVEGDIYDDIKQKKTAYTINNYSTTGNYTETTELADEVKTKISESIAKLKSVNPDLIKMSSFDLVELSHSWYSWRYYFNMAKSKGSYREAIPNEVIKSENKYFHL
ncbi:type II toxin-antitoxin system antitoxin SocA domain-containing protein [Chryseobacterium sp. DT-3]|uniref:type II toxin-antitoxin system antitoxin SocA domain-containing protein n=1 Tax=Chryseobacterium sp. DT-3 TaxID=3396164 RepID=UPI003F1CC609